MAADPQPVDDRPSLLDVLRADAARLTESELPTTEELRPLVGALVQALERVAGDQVTAFASDPAPEPVTEPAYTEVNPGAGPTPPAPPAPVVVEPPVDETVGAPTAPDTVTTPAPPTVPNPGGQA